MFFFNNRTNIPHVLMMGLIDMRVPDSDFLFFSHILESTLAARQPVNIKSTVQEQGSGRRGRRRLAGKAALRYDSQSMDRHAIAHTCVDGSSKTYLQWK